MFSMGDRVTWFSSHTQKEGFIVEVVPTRAFPQSMDKRKLGSNRDHETYVVKGGEQGKRSTLYWPRANLLQKAGHLSPEEINWCHDNADRIRQMMSESFN